MNIGSWSSGSSFFFDEKFYRCIYTMENESKDAKCYFLYYDVFITNKEKIGGKQNEQI